MKMNRVLFLFVLLLSAILVTACTSMEKVQKIESEIEEVEDVIRYRFGTIWRKMAIWEVPGMSLAVVKDGKLRWAKGYGMANTITGREVDKETLFQAGSISKTITALGALKLVEDGSIGLDEDVNIYLKSWKVPYDDVSGNEKVTLRQLLSHTSGLTGDGGWGYLREEYLPTIEEELLGLGHHPKLTFQSEPGETWVDSNGGYGVVQILIEDITGLPFETYMSQSIFIPLGMSHSTYHQPLPVEWHENASIGSDWNGNITDGLWHNFAGKAARGLWTTPTDLAKVFIEIYEIYAGKTDGILSPLTIELMLTEDNIDDEVYYGLGINQLNDGDSSIFANSGKSSSGFISQFVFFADKGDAYIIFTNGWNGYEFIEGIYTPLAEYYQWEHLELLKLLMTN